MRRRTSVAANPVLIGAATVLVVIVAVFIAYNANNGLPFVPTYKVIAQVPDAANLVVGNDVRIGGDRVGLISDIKPVVHRDGSVTAKLVLKLDTNVKPLPVDSTVIVRPRSALGLKYLEMTRGHSSKDYPDGATMPLSAATPQPVEIDQFFNMFDAPTRAAQQTDLREFGNALAGRGADLNEAIQVFQPLLANLTPVMHNLADPSTGLGNFFPALERTASLVAPVAEQQGQLFRNLATTFEGFAAIARPYLQDTISGGPHALDTAIRTFPFERTFLANSAGFFHDLQPGMVALRQSAPQLADAFATGVTALQQSPPFNEQVKQTMVALKDFAQDPQVPLGFKGLKGTVDALEPSIAHLSGAQVNCNYLAILFNNLASMSSDGDKYGNWLRITTFSPPIGANSEGGPASAPANDPSSQNPNNHLHSNPYPLVGAPGQHGICMAGNEYWEATPGTTIGNPSGQHPTHTAQISKTLNSFYWQNKGQPTAKVTK